MKSFAPFSRIEIAGLDGVILYFDGLDLNDKNQAVLGCRDSILAHSPPWLKQLVPGYDSLLITYDVGLVDHHQIYHFIQHLTVESSCFQPQQHHRIPVLFGAESANDLSLIARHCKISEQAVIDIFCQSTYRVFALGFAPGFGYMGELPEVLSTPRLAEPRKQVPKGAVAIADRQVAVYPSVSPGGWHLLGVTHVDMMLSQDTTRLSAGDTVSFYPVCEGGDAICEGDK